MKKSTLASGWKKHIAFSALAFLISGPAAAVSACSGTFANGCGSVPSTATECSAYYTNNSSTGEWSNCTGTPGACTLGGNECCAPAMCEP